MTMTDETYLTKSNRRYKWRNDETGITVIKHKRQKGGSLPYVVKNRYGSSTYDLRGMDVRQRNSWRRKALEGF